MSPVTMQIVGVLVFGVVVGLEIRNTRRSEEIILDWAKMNSYRLLESRNMFFAAGPFFWKKSRQQRVFRVVIRDEAGTTKSAWILCGNWWGRLTAADIDVRWAD